MKKFTLIIFLFFPFLIQAQEKIGYHLNGEHIEFNVSNSELYVEFGRNMKDIVAQKFKDSNFNPVLENSALISLKDLKSRSNFAQLKADLLRDNPEFSDVRPVLIYKDGVKQICTNEIIIKLSSSTGIEELINDLQFTSRKDQFVENQYIVSLKKASTTEIFQLIETLNQDKRVDFAEPNFIKLIKPHTSDPYFSSQWSIKNLGYLGGTTDADMDVEEAWTYGTGSGVKVAVLDEGVELSHPDLSSNLLSGYDATTGDGNLSGGANTTNNDAHGTACAGIIAAQQNSIGTVGVAYNAKVIPVRIAYSTSSTSSSWTTYDTWQAAGFNWAVTYGEADVISNSWGGGSPSTALTNAINSAVSNGVVVLFSTGNDNTSTVSYPASLSNVIAVGATSMCDERKSPSSCDGETTWGSNYGSALDVVAPGVKIYTSDLTGSAGYVSGNYTSTFNGTSSACPNVAGVVALMLSAKPSLSVTQVKDLLEQTTDKAGSYSYSHVVGYPNGTRNNEMGYGRVNAARAVEGAYLSSVSISGSGYFCSSTSTYSLSNLPSGMTATWTASSNLNIVSSTGTSITVSRNTSDSQADGYVKATFPYGYSISKSITAGEADVDYVVFENGIGESDFFCTTHSGNTYEIFPKSNATHQVRLKAYPSLNVIYTSGSGLTGDAGTLNYTPSTEGYYLFEVRRTNSCGTTEWFGFEVEFVNCSWFFSSSSSSSFNIFPNPSSEYLTIKRNPKASRDNSTQTIFKSVSETNYYEIFDKDLNIVVNGTVSETETVDISKLAKGSYILRIQLKRGTESHQIIVK